MKTKLLITGLAFMAMTTLVSAQNKGAGQRQQNSANKNMTFVDANKNGICDNYENRTSNSTAGTGNTNCRGCGQGKGKGQGMGRGRGQGCANTGQGKGMNFVDANKNGICDLRETPAKK